MLAQIDFLDTLMQQAFSELKLAAILFIQLHWKSDMVSEKLLITSRWFDDEWISDWNVCDWLCVRLLSPALNKRPDLAIAAFTEWNVGANLWKARASLVPFAQAKSLPDHSATVLRFSQVLIMRDERFCKTPVGWVLRVYPRIDRKFINDFLSLHKDWTTTEVIKNATKYI